MHSFVNSRLLTSYLMICSRPIIGSIMNIMEVYSIACSCIIHAVVLARTKAMAVGMKLVQV